MHAMATESPVCTKDPIEQSRSRPREALHSLSIARLPWPCLIPAVFSGMLLYLCHFSPVGDWLALYGLAPGGWLAWIALVPLLCLVRIERPEGAFPGENVRGWRGL